MIEINNNFLKKEFDVFSKIENEAEKALFLKKIKNEFSAFSEKEKEEVRQDWTENLSTIDHRLKEIQQEIKNETTLEVYPSNQEESYLLKMILNKMGIKFALK